MRRKIAIYADGCGNEYMGSFFSGIKTAAEENDLDVYAFISYAFKDELKQANVGETNIFHLANMEDFDGIMLMANSLNAQVLEQEFRQRLTTLSKPCVTLETELPGLDVICADNVAGIYQLTKHLIEEHQVRRIVFMEGDSSGGESDLRLSGVRKAMEEYGLSFREGDLVKGNWDFGPAKELTRAWLDQNTELPDAFMAANDMMALGICEVLKQRGYDVPQDVIVTGYDHLGSARVYSPGITSVDRKGFEIGYQTVVHLLKKMEGEKVDRVVTIETSPAIEESCGCFNNYRNMTLRNQNCRHMVVEGITKYSEARHNWSLKRTMNEANSEAHLYELLEQNFYSAILTEFDVAMMLNKRFIDALSQDVSLDKNYSKYQKLLYGVWDGKLLPHELMKTEDLIPAKKADGKAHAYFFLPLHNMDDSYGYMVAVDAWDYMTELALNNMADTVSQGLTMVYQNIRLENMNRELFQTSVRDLPTGVYNRTGYDQVVIPALKEKLSEGKNCFLMIVDINRMKQINDLLGHLQGDIAIKTVADTLMAVKLPEWYAVRYGGDEFLLIGEYEGEDTLKELGQRLPEYLAKKCKETNLPFRLQVSFGSAVIPANQPLDLDEAVRIADNSMYKMKEHLHEVEGI